MPSFCKSCQENGVNTRIEWQPNPDKPGKNKPFDIDKNEWHTCPYWKPMKNFRQAAQKVEQEVSSGKSPTTLQGLTEDMVNLQGWKISVETRLQSMEKAIRDFGEVIAKDSYKKASEIPKKDEFIAED